MLWTGPLSLLVLLLFASSSYSLSLSTKGRQRLLTQEAQQIPISRESNEGRAQVSIMRRTALVALISPLIFAPKESVAFDNAPPEYVERFKNIAKKPGTMPANLGLQPSNGKLLICDDAPNCFSTTGDESHQLTSWKAPSKLQGNKAMEDLLETIRSYPPGQKKIDRGGFSILTANENYVYVQFDSGKHGFVDDVEFALMPDSKSEFQVRSASRIGFLDLGVHAKRLNWISANLRDKGWKVPEITKEDYPEYFQLIEFTFDDYIRSVLYPDYCPVPSLPLDCKEPPRST